MLVVTPSGIKDHSAELGDDFEDKLKRIQENYKNNNLFREQVI